MELSLEGMLESLATLMDPAVHQNNPRVVHTVYTITLPRLSSLIKEALPTLESYLKLPTADHNLADQIISRVRAAKNYRTQVEAAYVALHLSGADFKSTVNDNVKKFDPDKLNVQDFIRIFTAKFGHTGSAEDVSLKLFDDYLPRSVQVRVGRSRSFTDLVAQLKEIYGTPNALARIELSRIELAKLK